jgi:hypothetical protein
MWVLKITPYYVYRNLMTLKIIVNKAEEGGFWAEVPALPGCVSRGKSLDELRENIGRRSGYGWRRERGCVLRGGI